MSEIIVSEALQMSETNTPTRAGELVQNVAEIYNIVNPRVGMVVYVAEEEKNYIITELKAVEIGGVNVPDAAVKSYELLDRHATDRLMGRAADSNSLTDPFRFLGNYEGSLQELWVALDGWTGDSTSGYEGFFRARSGNSIIEIASYPLSYKDNYWLQVVKGKLKVTNNGELTSATNYNVVSRVHNYKGAGWSNWEIIAGGDLIAAINENIESLSEEITAEEVRAKGAEQALELSINSEITRAKAVEQGLTNKINTLMGGVPDETLDTIKKIADWLLSDETGTQAIINKIGANTTAIKEEATRAKGIEAELQQSIDDNNEYITAVERSLNSLGGFVNSLSEDILAEETRATKKENELAENITKAPKEALRQLYTTFGASYNSAKDTFTFNTLEGLSWAEMAATFLYRDIVYRLDIPRVGQQISNLRVINPLPSILASPSIKIQGLNTFYGTGITLFTLCRLSASSYETYLNAVRTDTAPVCTYLYDTFRQCSKLKVVFPINIIGCQTLKKETFEGCVALKELRLLNLPLSLNLDSSPLISKASILYIVTNAAPATAITITLHADAYARLADDADIVAALATQPLITLVSA